MTRKMRAEGTCRTDATGPACRRGETRGAWRVARFAVVAVMAIVFGLVGMLAADVAYADFQYAKGTTTARTATGTTTVNVGFQPKAVLFYWANRTTDGYTAGSHFGYGFTDGTNQGVVAIASDDATGTSNAGSTTRTDASIAVLSTGTPVVDAQASVTLNASGFVVNWTNAAGSAWLIHYVALGGTDITNAKVGSFNQATTTSPVAQSVTGVGFQPDMVMFLAPERGAALNANSTTAAFNLGMMTATDQVALGWGTRDGQTNNQSVGHGQYKNHGFVGVRRNAADSTFTRTSMDADGFSLNWDNAPGGTQQVLYLALKGGSYKVGAFNKRSGTGTNPVTGVGFQPNGLMLFSYNHTATDSTLTTNAAKISIGAGTDTTNEGAIWAQHVYNGNATSTTDTNRSTISGKIIRMSTSATTTNDEADLTSLDTDGFTLNWSTSTTTAKEVLYFAAGPTPCTPGPAPTMNGGTFSGDPVDLCTAVTAGTNTVTNYKVTGGGANADDNFNDNSLDTKWTKSDFGPDTGTVSETGGTLSVEGGGADIWDIADQFTFVSQSGISGDFSIQVKVNSQENTNAWAKAGLMVREQLTAGSKDAYMVTTPGNGARWQYRDTTNAAALNPSVDLGGSSTAPVWLRITRVGDLFTADFSTNGTTWTQSGQNTIVMADPVYIGLANTSHLAGTLSTAVFEDFVTTGITTTLYDGASCNNIPSTTWTAGTYNLQVTYTDSCSTAGNVASGSFDFSTCSESTPSSIIWNGTNTAAGNFSGSSLATISDITAASLQYKVTAGVVAPANVTRLDGSWTTAVTTNNQMNYTVPAGSNRAMIISWGAENTTTAITSVSATYGGVNVPVIVERGDGAATFNNYVWFGICNEACIAAAGGESGANIVVTNNGTLNVGIIGAATYGSVNQTTPIYAVNSATSAASPISTSVNTIADAKVIFGVNFNGQTNSLNAIGGWTEGFDIPSGAAGGGNSHSYATVERDAQTAATPVSVTATAAAASSRTNIAIFALNPGAASVETTIIDWTSDPISANGVLTNTNSYNLYARGNDTECNLTYYGDSIAQTTAEGTKKTFTWSSCVENATVNVADPGVISGPTPIVVTVGGSGGLNPQWSADGGTNWYNSGQSYTPPASCATAPVTFIGRATGTCGTITDPTPVNGTYDTRDSGPGGDLAVLTVTPSGGSVTGVVNVQMAVGTETVPGSLNSVVLNVTGSTSCNDTNSVMTWNSGASRWEASWDTAACATASVESGVTLTASATDPDCSDFVTGFSTVTIDNTCIDGTSTVSWTPPGGTVTTPIVVTASRSGGQPGFDQVSFDNGISWLPSGSTYTPGIDKFGTENFYVRAYDTCGKWMYGGPYAVDYDGRLDSVRPLSITATSAGKTSIRVLFRYASDRNNNAQVTVKYKLSTDLTWTTVGPVVDGGDADASVNENVLFMLTALTTDSVYDIEVTATDANGIDWSTLQASQPAAPPWTGTVRLSSWTDVSMLHNALRFACDKIGYADETTCVANGGTWNLNRKWTGGWGLPDSEYPGAQYDGFECSTCHMKDSSNVKRVVASVLAPTGSFPGSIVNLQSAVEGASDFGNDSDDHTTSSRVCEVCHSVTQYHRFDTSAQINKNHNNNTDCIRCHEHKVGFRASCDSCHGTPPVSALGLVTTDPTGSTVWGEHQKHAVEIGFDCKTCHSGWDGTNQMPNAGNLNIGFGADVNPRFAGAVNNVNGGTYEGRPAASGSYTADAGTGTAVTQDTAADDMSCATYCHGYGRPIWNPTATVACGSCHGAVGSGVGDRSGAPTGIGASKDLSGSLTGYKVGKHATHIDDSIFQTGDPCALCHSGFGYGNTSHVNGTINVALRQASQSLTPTTTGGAGLSGTFTPGVPGVSPGSCDNMDCHGYTPWDSAAKLTCTQACHGYPPTTTVGFTNYTNFDFVSHNTPNGEQYLRDNHGQCKYCHGWNDDGDGNLPISGMTVSELTAMQGDPAEAPNFFQYDSLTYTNGQHGNGTVTMNSDGDANDANDAGYDPVTGGCNNAVCHGNDVAHRFNVAGNTNTMLAADIGPGDCGACHTTGVGGATIVTPTSPHTKVTKTGSFTSCGACHSGHYTKAGGVQIPNNLTVGINYTGTQHGGIKLGGPGTDASISGKTTEAEICWACHALAANNISEWGTNANQTTTPPNPVPVQYNYGTLSSNAASSGGWYSVTTPGSEAGATWTSAHAEFAYKTGAIQSTHSANNAGTSTVTGNNYEKVEQLDAVANIRCSYCHDVHDAVGPNGAPYLRGTWWGNPYNEDGAPQAGTTYANTTRFGAVPRGNGANGSFLGGFYIDINNKRFGTATETNNGTAYANPTATGGSGTGGAWTFGDSAGLCILCHTNNVSTMDQTTGEGLWLGTANGHANAVIDGSGTGGSNIFNSRGGATNNSRAQMHWAGSGGRPEDWNSGFRNSAGDSMYSYAPLLNPLGENNETTTPNTNNWGTLTIDNTTVNSKYHKFSCSKCHNPHASRLPKLMITNCLDTKHNTWDDDKSLNAQNDTLNQNRSFSNWSSAQNCHRLGGIIPASRVIPGTGGTYPEPVDTGAVAAPHQTGTSYGNRGWNYVTPW